MKKLLLSALLLLAAGAVNADQAVTNKFQVPVSANNVADPGLRSAGVDVAYLVTSTTPALATDAEGDTFTEGFIHYVIVPSTGAVNSVYLELRSTNTANTSSARLVPRIAPLANGAALQANPVFYFDPPVPFSNGLSVNLLPAGSAPATGVEFGVGIRWKRQ